MLLPHAPTSVDFSACANAEDLLLLMYLVRRRLVDVLNASRAQFHPGAEAIDGQGRRGMIVRVNSRWAYLVARDGVEWRAPVGSVQVIDR